MASGIAHTVTGRKVRNGLTIAVAAMGMLAATATPGQAQADIITPVSGTVNVQLNASYGIEYAIDGSGLSGGGASGDILSEAHTFGGGGNSWHSPSADPSTIEMTFDLGGTFSVDSVHVWNWSANNGVVTRSVKTVDVSFSTDGGAAYGNLIDNIGDFLLPTSGSDAVPVSTIAFPAAVSGVTHIKLADFMNHGNSYTAMSEIRFGGSESQPNDPILRLDLVNGAPDLDFGLVAGGGPFSESRTLRFVNDGPTNAIEIFAAPVSGDAAYSLADIAVNGSGGVSLRNRSRSETTSNSRSPRPWLHPRAD